MLEIIAASTIALALTVVVKSSKSNASRLTESRASLTIGVQIICGDCSGNDDRVLKTYLGRDGLCAQCGGRSYILASARFSPAQQVMMARLSERESLTDYSRLEPIESSVLGTLKIHSVTALDSWRLVT